MVERATHMRRPAVLARHQMKLRRVESNFDMAGWLRHGGDADIQACVDALTEPDDRVALRNCLARTFALHGLKFKFRKNLRVSANAGAACLVNRLSQNPNSPCVCRMHRPALPHRHTPRPAPHTRSRARSA